MVSVNKILFYLDCTCLQSVIFYIEKSRETLPDSQAQTYVYNDSICQKCQTVNLLLLTTA